REHDQADDEPDTDILEQVVQIDSSRQFSGSPHPITYVVSNPLGCVTPRILSLSRSSRPPRWPQRTSPIGDTSANPSQNSGFQALCDDVNLSASVAGRFRLPDVNLGKTSLDVMSKPGEP